ncbi:MAG: threonine/serine exporter family protein, partial [[Clostridium] scindens]
MVDIALEAGRILLKNGAEIFRVEETITRICHRFHVEHVDIFTLSHGIFISAENGLEEAYTKVKHVPLSAPHLGIVAEVNDLSRE